MSERYINKPNVKNNSENKSKQKLKKNRYKARPIEILIYSILITVFLSIFIFIIYKIYVDYNIEQKLFISKSNYAYKKIQNELIEYYKKNAHVYKSENESVDEFCLKIGEKFSDTMPDCTNSGKSLKTNFVFKNKKIEIIGMEKPPVKKEGTLVKDFIIDVNGLKKGKNKIGIDRVPVRIYSTGRMGGLLSPLNCSHEDFLEYDIEYADICNNESEINFLATNIPFGYDVFLIGGNNGNTKVIYRDIPFLRADCSAFAGDMANLYDYCEKKGYYWHKSCYQEYECSVIISKKEH